MNQLDDDDYEAVMTYRELLLALLVILTPWIALFVGYYLA